MRNDQYEIEETDAGNSAFEGLDLSKIFFTIKKNIVWVLLIILSTNILAYLYIRYTRPVYESTSILRLDIKSDANILGFGNLNQNLDNLAGEIELLKSNLFFSKVVEAVDMDISYYAYGRVLFQERYDNSPFRVEYKLKDRSFYDKPIDIEILNDEQFILSYPMGGERFSRAYEFGEEIEHPSYRFVVTLTEHFRQELKGTAYYFTINSDQAMVNYLSSNMIVEPVNFKANTIKVGFQGYDKQKIRDLVTVIDSVYLEYTKEKKNQATEQKLHFLDEQLEAIEERLSKYESYFENFTIDNKTNNLQSEIGKAIVKMEELDARKFQIQNTLESIEKLRQKVENEELVLTEPTSFVSYPEDILTYVQQLNALLNDKELTLASYKESSIAVKLKDQKIDLIKKDILGLIQTYDTQLHLQLEEIEEKKKEIENEFVQLPSKGTQYGKNERYYNLYESIFLSLIQKKNELEIAKAGTVTDFVVLLPATMPASPVAPQKLTILGIGAVSGIILSLMFLALGYVLNDKISSQSELEKLTQASILGTIPLNSGKKNVASEGLVVSKMPKSAISEAFRSVRTNMQFMGLRNEKKVISVTSTVGAEGKTFVACNLGNVIALSGQKVLIVDLDLRKPKVHRVFSVKNGEKGVSTHLIGKYALDECITKIEEGRLDIISAGAIPPNPSELIVSQAFEQMLQQLKERYDVIILDSPPVGLVTDGVLVMEKADIPLYVFRADYSRRNFVRTFKKLHNTKKFSKLAIILNGLSSTGDRSYTYSRYGYGYFSEEEEEKGFLKKVQSFFTRQKA
ncbi:tyrosine-protein kinase Etk/Wzc [Catalinimonas alkaloidigena]|uniref:polysaccharide biosynthesis tyrosine autokinase n=1 Tax=Catalinimonas alkaloidigena TaxID=1075417 RepID=UPI00240613AD|nr:polysaccharide biosynthesis tyrosine autokinase [Catalinimonas alkaloidigena]MDF9799451.1 tyrosine-protein kinase Etk/Wzc [Catalinimonas alkaloidigena]